MEECERTFVSYVEKNMEILENGALQHTIIYAKIDNHGRMDTALWFCPISG